MKSFLTGFLFAATTYCGQAQPLIPHTVAFPSGTIWFYSYTPPHYSSTPVLLPLIISLHGAGESGETAADLPRVKLTGIPGLIDKGATMEFNWHGKTEGFVVLAPQTTHDLVGYWPVRYVNEMVSYAIANLRVDPKRIFIAGYSFGANGTWWYGETSGDGVKQIAGLVPASSFSTAGPYCNITDNKVAVWAFHGGNDNPSIMTSTINAINDPALCPERQAANFIPAVDTVYANGGHDIYNLLVYDTSNRTHFPNIYQWMLSVNRDLNPTNNQNPVPLIAGGPEISLTTPVKVRDFPLLDGSASHDDDIIMDYLWEQTEGPASLLPSTAADVATEKMRQYPTTKIAPPANSPVGVAEGVYKFRLRVKDYLTYLPGHTQFSTITVKVNMPASGHSAPAVDAGDDHMLANDEPVWLVQGGYTLYGSSLSAFNWRFVSGPAVASVYDYHGAGPYLGNDNNVRFINMTAPGNYLFEFSATNDYGEEGRDTIMMTRQGAVGGALPVKYSSFDGETKGAKNLLTWTTTAEINSARFDVQRSSDGLNFINIGAVTARGGTGNTYYSFEDNQPVAGLNYYRLSQVDKDGHTSLSKIISLNTRKLGLSIEKYPNPVHENLTVNVQSNVNGQVDFVVADMQGKVILRQQRQKNAQQLTTVLNVGLLQNGVYQMVVTIGGEKQVSSFVRY